MSALNRIKRNRTQLLVGKRLNSEERKKSRSSLRAELGPIAARASREQLDPAWRRRMKKLVKAPKKARAKVDATVTSKSRVKRLKAQKAQTEG